MYMRRQIQHLVRRYYVSWRTDDERWYCIGL